VSGQYPHGAMFDHNMNTLPSLPPSLPPYISPNVLLRNDQATARLLLSFPLSVSGGARSILGEG